MWYGVASLGSKSNVTLIAISAYQPSLQLCFTVMRGGYNYDFREGGCIGNSQYLSFVFVLFEMIGYACTKILSSFPNVSKLSPDILIFKPAPKNLR